MWVAGGVATALGAIALTVRRYESRVAFSPRAGEDKTPASCGVPFTARSVTSREGEHLRLWHLPRPDARAQVVYFHGNLGNLSTWTDILTGIWRQDFDLVAFDYRGYGLSTGAPSERGLYQDVEAVLDVVHREMRRANVPLIYWGRSLGTTMAAYAANVRTPDGIVLEAGFPSLRAMLAEKPLLRMLSWFSSYRFPAGHWISRVRVPALVLHGDNDRVVPYRVGCRLYRHAQHPKRFVRICGGDHNDTVPPDPDAYWSEIHRFVESLPATR